VVTQRAKALDLPDDVQARLCGTHPAGIGAAAVHECLAIVIVFLLAEAEKGEHDAFV
jgi:hypothetical protein